MPGRKLMTGHYRYLGPKFWIWSQVNQWKDWLRPTYESTHPTEWTYWHTEPKPVVIEFGFFLERSWAMKTSARCAVQGTNNSLTIIQIYTKHSMTLPLNLTVFTGNESFVLARSTETMTVTGKIKYIWKMMRLVCYSTEFVHTLQSFCLFH